MRGFVYAGLLTEEELNRLKGRLGLTTQLSWDLARLDFSSELRESGSAFNERAELRWRLKGDRYRVLLLSDSDVQGEIDGFGLEAVPGPWEAEELAPPTRLIDLKSPQFHPSFEEYPGLGTGPGALRCCVFSREGKAVFLSPRRLEHDEPKTE